MRRVGHRHPLLAALGLHGRDVEDKVGLLDARAGLAWAADLAVLAEGVADAADLEVLVGDLDLAAHGAGLAGVLAVGVRVAGLEEHLILLAFPKGEKKLGKDHVQSNGRRRSKDNILSRHTSCNISF